METIKIHSTGEQISVTVIDRGLATHRDGPTGNAAGQHRRKYAKSEDGRFFRLNRHGHWAPAAGHTLRDAEAAFA